MLAVPGKPQTIHRVLVCAAALMAGVFAVALFLRWYRRKAGQSGGAAQSGTPHELRWLHAAEQLTDQEFERPKTRMIGVERGAETTAPASAERGA